MYIKGRKHVLFDKPVCLPQTLLRHIQTSLTRTGGMAITDTGFDSRMCPAFPSPGS